MTSKKLAAIAGNIEKKLVGKPEAIYLVLCALLCRGHVLIEDVPGTGKTTLAHSLAVSLGCSFQRIQFTPDVMPSDITGFSMPDTASGNFVFKPGPVFNQIILADEINRSSPKTQSALLEVMQENQVTVDGRTYAVPEPFMVLATQNPSEHAGTYPLPEAQLDRFFIRVSLGYPTLSEEAAVLDLHDSGLLASERISSVADTRDILELQDAADQIHVSKPLKMYIAEIVSKTRSHPSVKLGVSPRGAIFLMLAAKGTAFLNGRGFATPDDVQKMAPHVLLHRMQLTPEARLNSVTRGELLQDIIKSTRLPDA